MKYLFSSLLVLFLFQGCNHTNVLPIPNIFKKNTDKPIEKECIVCNDDTSEFDDEFGEETEIKADPFSGYNKIMTGFNDTFFVYIFNPISKVYAYVLPNAIQQGVSNFIYNIEFPIRFTNNLLQGKFQNTLDESERFIINSTVGVAGLFDFATHYWQIPAHHEDFGQTLGYYGVGSGYHIVLPFLGPSNIRDIIGLTIDGYTSPIIYQNNLKKYKIPQSFIESAGIYGFKTINKNALNPDAYETLKKDAMDLYPFLRDTYEQKRTSDIGE
jgi:phospholipid-binding lipoprotein MlaA